LSYERWDFADFGGFWYKSGGRTTGVGVQAGNRLYQVKNCKIGRKGELRRRGFH
jgi:hypothetical protein